MSMEGREDFVVVAMTWEEAHELFTRCLRSNEEDTLASSSILKKLAKLLDSNAVALAA